ncbi:MAG: hypothetical protein ACRCU1_18580 [Alsobacter sp.]
MSNTDKPTATTTTTTTAQCACGTWSGEACACTMPLAEMTTVEYMPDQHRASHPGAA